MSLLFGLYAGIYDRFMKRFSLDDDTPILEYFEGVREKNVCDIGGGTGLLAHELVRRGNAVTIVDPCIKMTDIARKRNKKIKVISASIEDGVVTGPFDYIIVKDVLHHIRGQKKVVRECASILKEGGFLLVQDFAPDNKWTKCIFLLERFCLERVQPVEAKKLAAYAKKVGFVGEIHVLNARDYLYIGRRK